MKSAIYVLTVAVLLVAVVAGCMTTPDGRVVVDPAQLQLALETFDAIAARIEALNQGDALTQAEIEAERIRLEQLQSITQAIIDRLSGNATEKTAPRMSLNEVRAELGLE